RKRTVAARKLRGRSRATRRPPPASRSARRAAKASPRTPKAEATRPGPPIVGIDAFAGGLDAAARLLERAERALRASEAQYRLVFESAREGIWMMDAQTGVLLDVNPFFLDLVGYTRDELLG